MWTVIGFIFCTSTASLVLDAAMKEKDHAGQRRRRNYWN